MKIPEKTKVETTEEFMKRCFKDKTMVKQYPYKAQRKAICYQIIKKDIV